MSYRERNIQKKWSAWGDSITEVEEMYLIDTGKNLNLDYDNRGVGGDTIAMINTRLATLLSSSPDYFDDYDIVTLFVGINDYFNNVAAVDFYNGIIAFINTILAKRPEIPIIVFTPLEADRVAFPYKTANTVPLYVKDYRDNSMAAANYLGIPVVDLWAKYPLNSTTSGSITTDGVHPYLEGRTMLGKLFTQELKQYLTI